MTYTAVKDDWLRATAQRIAGGRRNFLLLIMGTRAWTRGDEYQPWVMHHVEREESDLDWPWVSGHPLYEPIFVYHDVPDSIQ